MVAKTSTMLPLGTPCPGFELPEPMTGKIIALQDFADKPFLLVAFLCNHCPYVKHIIKPFVALMQHDQHKGLAVVAINSNDITAYPEDSPEHMAALATSLGFTFPYLFDETQSTAKAFQAICTPEFYLFDQRRNLYYRGRFDGSTPKNNAPVTGQDLKAALDALLQGKLPPKQQHSSIGCNIKWRPGNEPDYFLTAEAKNK